MIITTKRLVLREFAEEDWSAVLTYQSDPRYLRYYDWSERTEQNVRAFVRMFTAWCEEEPRTKFQLAITLASDGQLIGNCGIRKKTLDAQEADIGYELDPRYWGCGYATEAARAILAFGFRELALHRVWAWCIAENIASVHVLDKIGMRQEGHLRQNEWMQGRWWDTLLYGILEQNGIHFLNKLEERIVFSMILNEAVRQALTSGHLVHLVTLNADGSPQVTLVWVGPDGDEIVCAHLSSWQKVKNIQNNAHVVFSMETGGKTGVLDNYLVITGNARTTEGGAPELLHRLAQIYVGPDTKFPADNSPPGYITHITVEQIRGVGPWNEHA